jgi:hypothetical protein
MTRMLALITFLVHNYDEAITFFTQALRCNLLEDTPWRAARAGSGCPNRLRQTSPRHLIAIGSHSRT